MAHAEVCRSPLALAEGLPTHWRVVSAAVGALWSTGTGVSGRPCYFVRVSPQVPTGPGFGFATASFSQHGRLEPPRRRANRARAVHKVAGTFDNVPGAQGVEWVPHCKRALQCNARSHCGAAPRRRSMSGLQGQRFSAARGLRQGPGRPHGAPEAAGVASLMTCATRRRGQLRFHNAPHFWHPPASRA